VRTAALLLLFLPSAAYADLVDLSERRSGRPSSWVVRAEGGNAFAPYGFAGGALSWLSESGFEFEAGAGADFEPSLHAPNEAASAPRTKGATKPSR